MQCPEYFISLYVRRSHNSHRFLIVDYKTFVNRKKNAVTGRDTKVE